MKKILVTGGCGFIGSHLSEYLLKLGYHVRVFDRYNSDNNWGWLEHSKNKKEIEVVLGDIRDFDSVLKASHGYKNIIHLAALIGIPYSYVSPLAYINSFDLPIKIIRPFNTFGPRQSARAIIPTIFSQIYSKSKLIKIGNLNTTRDFTYVLDLCVAFEKLLKCKKNISYGNIFNVGSNNEISIKELISVIQNVTGINKKILIEKKRIRKKSSEVSRLRCDYSLFNNLTGWKPSNSINDGLKIFNNWYLNNRQVYKPKHYNV